MLRCPHPADRLIPAGPALRLLGLISCLLVALAACAAPANTPGPVPTPGGQLKGGMLATFQVGRETFRVWTTDSRASERLEDLAGPGSPTGTPSGPVLAGPGLGDHNSPWSWHFDLQGFSIVEAAGADCDGLPGDVEENFTSYSQVIGGYCPSAAVLLDITHYP